MNTNTQLFLRNLKEIESEADLQVLLSNLNINQEFDYERDKNDLNEKNWKKEFLHFLPVGLDTTNFRSISLDVEPEAPIVERVINSFEAIIDLKRYEELIENPKSEGPVSVLDAVQRYFGIPRIDHIPTLPNKKQLNKKISELSYLVKVVLSKSNHSQRPHNITIIDKGCGQSNDTCHGTILGLGGSKKIYKNYAIGKFGQGGSSTFSRSQYSIIITRAHSASLKDDQKDLVSWTVVRARMIKGARAGSICWEYLASSLDGRLPAVNGNFGDEIDLPYGTYIKHIGYDLKSTLNLDPYRDLYQSLNHALPIPQLPYRLFTKQNSSSERMCGNLFTLSNLTQEAKEFDKVYQNRRVGEKAKQL